jgi:Gluconate 2-dehydrogenase subunit 3
MERRVFLREAIMLVGGTAALSVLPGCSWQDAPNSLPGETMTRVCKIIDLMIPRTKILGGLDAGADKFFDKVMANWASAETRAKLKWLLDHPKLIALDSMDKAEAEKALTAFDEEAFAEKNKQWGQFKKLAMLGYFGSEKYMTEIEKFELVPGRFDPCVKVEGAKA